MLYVQEEDIYPLIFRTDFFNLFSLPREKEQYTQWSSAHRTLVMRKEGTRVRTPDHINLVQNK